MPDMEKVKKGLEVCVDREPGKYNCNECPYEIDGNWCEINLAKDALILLKEQEPLAVYEGKVNKCVCGNGINRYWHPKYCGFCGKKLEWY